jgi:hypothetical protein
MTSLFLKRGKFSRPSGKVVGRIYEDAHLSTPPELRWFWSVTSIWPATPGVTNGTAATREQAMARFRWAWERES